MRFKKRSRRDWRTKFAWLPISFGDSYLWLTRYKERLVDHDYRPGDTIWREQFELMAGDEVETVIRLGSF